MVTKSDSDVIMGILLVVLGVLMLVGTLQVPFLALLIAVAMIIAGILIFMGKLGGPKWLAIVLVAVGAFLLLPLPVSEQLAANLAKVAGLIGAIALIVFGVLKAMHRV